MDRLNLSQYSRLNFALWLALSFQAGFINVGGFLACHRFVTHTTGFATQFGAEIAQNHYLTAAGSVSVPLFFLIGAMISGFFIDRRVAQGSRPRYTLIFALIAGLLISVTLLGQGGFFGEFGSALDIRLDYTLLALLCLASGLQNAAITSASGATIRTTHLTGLTTDLGIGLVRIFSHHPKAQPEKLATLIRICLISGFVLGSTVGAFAFLRYDYFGFLVPGMISVMLLAMGLRR